MKRSSKSHQPDQKQHKHKKGRVIKKRSKAEEKAKIKPGTQSYKKTKFKVGDRVMLVNVAKVEFEGSIGTISGPFNYSKKRWPVKLDKRKKKANLRPENLKLIQREPKFRDEAYMKGDPSVRQSNDRSEWEEQTSEAPNALKHAKLEDAVGEVREKSLAGAEKLKVGETSKGHLVQNEKTTVEEKSVERDSEEKSNFFQPTEKKLMGRVEKAYWKGDPSLRQTSKKSEGEEQNARLKALEHANAEEAVEKVIEKSLEGAAELKVKETPKGALFENETTTVEEKSVERDSEEKSSFFQASGNIESQEESLLEEKKLTGRAEKAMESQDTSSIKQSTESSEGIGISAPEALNERSLAGVEELKMSKTTKEEKVEKDARSGEESKLVSETDENPKAKAVEISEDTKMAEFAENIDKVRYEPGKYKLKVRSWVKSGISVASKPVRDIELGDCVTVTDVQTVSEENRIRGRISDGWITLYNLSKQKPLVDPVDEKIKKHSNDKRFQQAYESGLGGIATLYSDGSVMCSGDSRYGGNAGEKQDLLINVKSIVPNHSAFAALKKDGSVVVWGDSRCGGDAGEKQPQLTNVKSISSTTMAFSALIEDGSVVVWDSANAGGHAGTKQNLLKNVKSIVGAWYAFAALKVDGSVVAWGDPEYGGDAGAKQYLLMNVKTIVGNKFAFAALKGDRSIVVWGDADKGGDAGDKQPHLVDIIYLAKADKAFAVRQEGGKEIVWGNKEDHASALENLHKLAYMKRDPSSRQSNDRSKWEEQISRAPKALKHANLEDEVGKIREKSLAGAGELKAVEITKGHPIDNETTTVEERSVERDSEEKSNFLQATANTDSQEESLVEEKKLTGRVEKTYVKREPSLRQANVRSEGTVRNVEASKATKNINFEDEARKITEKSLTAVTELKVWKSTKGKQVEKEATLEEHLGTNDSEAKSSLFQTNENAKSKEDGVVEQSKLAGEAEKVTEKIFKQRIF